MYNYVDNSIRGGISIISTQHAQANNPSFPDTYDSNLPNQNLIYLDANSEEITALKLEDLSDDKSH